MLFHSFLYTCTLRPQRPGIERVCFGSSSLRRCNCNNNEVKLLVENDDDDSVKIESIVIDTEDGHRMRYRLDSAVCLDSNNCGQHSAIFDLNTITWEDATNQDLTCNIG